MKIKFLTVITSLLAAAFMITSCLDDNEVETEYSSESSITSFAIKEVMLDSELYSVSTSDRKSVV